MYKEVLKYKTNTASKKKMKDSVELDLKEVNMVEGATSAVTDLETDCVYI